MADNPLKVVFAGTPEFAAEALRALIATPHFILAVYTQPDRPAGRGRKLTPSPVKELALARHLEVRQPLTLKDAGEQAALRALQPDLMIVVAYGLLLPKAVLEIPRLGCINIHASLLPRWRGAAPIQRAILAGDQETGVTIMQMDVGLDTGAMLLKQQCAIEANDTAQTLHDRLAKIGAAAMTEALVQLQCGTLQPEVQDDGLACYAHKLSKEEAALDWSQAALSLERQVRAFNPWPVAQSVFGGETVRVWQAQALPERTQAEPGSIVAASKQGIDVATGDGVLRLLSLQFPGAKPLAVGDLINARPELRSIGQRFESLRPDA
ncbi:MAG: methionyl-tRNA formyltransferase [Gammaproteobacteria bacterium]|nr:methionyl-tRNA formyltransferase [Gammaproteobacteria bacterium]